MMNFGEMGNLLDESRRKFHYSQEMVAEIVGVSDRTIRNIEYGLTVPELETILKLWDLYELPCESLFLFYTRDAEMESAIEYYRKKSSSNTGRNKKVPLTL